MKKLLIYTWLPALFFAFTTMGLASCSNDDEEEISNPTQTEQSPTEPTTPEEGLIAVDLGLPSGTKWASCNVGATKPEGYGDYYAWGETATKEIYNESTAIYYDNTTHEYKYIGNEISGTEYDAATKSLGDDWRMPTKDDYMELFQKCSWFWTIQNNVYGYNIIGPNGNRIFLPAAGVKHNATTEHINEQGAYWLSTINTADDEQRAFCIMLRDGARGLNNGNRIAGFSIRAVKNGTPNTSTPADDERAVDLGLSVKWASCNVDATEPWEYGGYYAWGETEIKSSYNQENYIYYNNGSYTNIGINIPGTQYDVAHVKWGGPWRMPSRIEMYELRDRCTWEKETLNGVNGCRITGPNGNSIFLPNAGFYSNNKVIFKGSDGHYWTGSLYEHNDYQAINLGTYGDKGGAYISNREDGKCVRPVCK